MSLIQGKDLAVSFLERDIFANVSFMVQPKEKIGLVGINGAGKTSLFRLMTGELKPTAGEITISKGCKLGLMAQHLAATADSVFEELLTVFNYLMEMEQEINRINAHLTAGTGDRDKLILRQAELNQAYLNEGGMTYKSMVRSSLLGLGFKEEEFTAPVETLSGGQRSKLCLAKLLLAKADVLLLDEPTNHLDITALEWLEDFLKNYNGTFMVISHDRYFLDKVTNQTYDLENGKLAIYKGNYSEFLVKKEKEREITERHNENVQREINRLESIIEQQKRWNREKNLVTAASKAKSVARLSKDLVNLDNAPKELRFKFKTLDSTGNDVLYATDISKSFGEKQLFNKVDVLINKGERVLLLGENGCGKSTLFKVITGACLPDTGEIRLGAGVKVGYFDQIQKLFHSDKNVLSEIWSSFPTMTETEIRTALAAFLFTGKDLEKPCSVLSGGERARLGILKIMLSGANFLLLDEPTNHLDIASRQGLEQALEAYDGTILAISHDRFFINKLADRILNMAEGALVNYLGNYDYYVEKKALLKITTKQEQAETEAGNVSENKLDYLSRKKQASEMRKLQTALTRLEEKIAQLEGEKQELNRLLASPEIGADYEQILELSTKLEAVGQDLEAALEEWTETSVLLEEINN